MKNIKLACADFTFPLLPHEKVMDLIALLDMDGIDIGLFSGRSHLTPESEFQSIKRSARRLKTEASARGLAITDVYLQLSADLSAAAINHPDTVVRSTARNSFLKLIDYATEINADHITILPGMIFPGESATESLKRCVDELAWRVEQLKNGSLILGVEAHVGSPFQHPKEAESLIDAIPGLTLTLDYTHFIRNGYTQEEIDPLLRFASHFHARGAKKGSLQTSIKENIIDYKKIIHALMRNGYQGWIGLEYVWIDWEGCNKVDNLSETIQLRDIVNAAMNELTIQKNHNEN